MGHHHAMGPDGNAAAATGKHGDDSRDMYQQQQQQRPYQSASGSSADYSTGGGNLDVSNKKMARLVYISINIPKKIFFIIP